MGACSVKARACSVKAGACSVVPSLRFAHGAYQAPHAHGAYQALHAHGAYQAPHAPLGDFTHDFDQVIRLCTRLSEILLVILIREQRHF